MYTEITKEKFLHELALKSGSVDGPEFVGTYGSFGLVESVVNDIDPQDMENFCDHVTLVNDKVVETECGAICLDTSGSYSFGSMENSCGIKFLIVRLDTPIFYNPEETYTRYFIFAFHGNELPIQAVENPAASLFNAMTEILPKSPITLYNHNHYCVGSSGVWATNDEILCPSHDDLDAIVKIFDSIIKDTGSDELIYTGYYDPDEDSRNDEPDEFTGYWYVSVE